MAGKDLEASSLSAGDLAEGDILETNDIVFASDIESFINWDIGLPVLTTRDSTGYSPPAPKEHIFVVQILRGSSARKAPRPIVLHKGRICVMFVATPNTLKKI